MPRVSLKDTNKSFEVKENDVLYDALFDQGEKLPHGCLSGSCGACRVEVIAGKDNLHKPGAIEQNTIEAIKDEAAIKGLDFSNKEIRLSCRAKVLGDVTIHPIK